MLRNLFILVLVAVGFSEPLVFHPTANAAAQEDSGALPKSRFSVRWIPDLSDTNKMIVEVSGLSGAAILEVQRSNWTPLEWQRLLSVYAEQGDLTADIGLPPMLGHYGVRPGALFFEPQFPLEPGVKYRAIVRPDQLHGEGSSRNALITALFQMPPRRVDPTTVLSHVYPSADVLPENLLKFYLLFSAPMSRGHIYDHMHLRDDAGKDIELPFLEIDEELWDPAMTRLTLFIDPGRIKRGVRPLEEIGPALEEGKRYTLVIDQAWKDGTGNPLKSTFHKSFKVGSPDRDPPDPARWKIQPPRSETSEPLTIDFSEPMDHALAQRMIHVIGESGAPVNGKTALEDLERRWVFSPTQPWRRGAYKLLVQTTIEDLAGNNIGKPFEVDLFEKVQRRIAQSTVSLPFDVR